MAPRAQWWTGWVLLWAEWRASPGVEPALFQALAFERWRSLRLSGSVLSATQRPPRLFHVKPVHRR
jgi:hypothetical protein